MSLPNFKTSHFYYLVGFFAAFLFALFVAKIDFFKDFVFVSKKNILISFFLKFGSFFIALTFFEVINFITICLCIIMFLILFHKNSIISILYQHFKKLPFKNKLFFVWFTLNYALPNKILIHNNISNRTVTILTCLILIISNVFPLFVVLYLLFWINIIESYCFAMLYTKKKSFKAFFDNGLFNDNPTLNTVYFEFFWGNMNMSSLAKGRAQLAGTVISGMYTLARSHEKALLRDRSQIELPDVYKTSPPKNTFEALQTKKDLESYIIDRDLTILSTERFIIKSCQKILNSLSE
jgi:hypothetical protein